MHATILTEEKEADAEAWSEGESHTLSNCLSVMCNQVAREESFGKEEKKDNQ